MGIWWYVGRDERAIKRVIRKVAEYASNNGGNISNALALQNLAEGFTKDAQIKWRWPEWPKIKTGEGLLEGRERIRESVIIAKRSDELKFEIENLEISAKSGVGKASGKVLGHFSSGDLATFETVFDLVKNNRWQIKSVLAL